MGGGLGMAIYARRLNTAQRRALRRYEHISGFEPMHQDELDAGEMDFAEMWRRNLHWLESMYDEVSNINLNGTGA